MSYNPHPTKGPGWWQIWSRITVNGKRKTKAETFCGTEEEAARIDLYLKQSSRGSAPQTITPFFRDKIIEYIDEYSIDHLDTTNITRHLFRWRDKLGNRLFSEVSEQDITLFKRERLAEGIKPVTINKEISALSGFLKWAAKKKYCAKPDFIERFSAKKTKSPLPDVPTREEVLALINAMIWPQCGYFACLYYAGMRASEAEGLLAENCYVDRRMMIVTGKGNKQRVVPIVDELLPWIQRRLTEVDTGLMWTTRTGQRMVDPKQQIKWAAKRAGLTRRMYPHLLRHAFGTHATLSGVGIRQLQYAMGHTSSQTTEIYTTLGHNAIIDDITGKFGKNN